MQHASRVNIGFIRCQEQAEIHRVVDDAHQIPIRLCTEFSEFGLLCGGGHESIRESASLNQLDATSGDLVQGLTVRILVTNSCASLRKSR
jgi:hypothetical protein